MFYWFWGFLCLCVFMCSLTFETLHMNECMNYLQLKKKIIMALQSMHEQIAQADSLDIVTNPARGL